MAVNFNIQFRINATTRVIRLTDTSTGFTYGKGCFKVEFPDGSVRNLPDFTNPDLTASGGYIDIPCVTDINNNVITGAYTISYAVTDNTSTIQTPLSRQFDFNWIEPSNGITNLSDVVIPEVVFRDATSYSPIGSFTGTLTRTISSSFPSTSEASAQTPVSSTSSNTINVVSAVNYYEGVYTATSAVSITYTHSSNSWLTVFYTRTFSKTFSIKKCPNQLELVAKINTYRGIIDAYKETNDTQFNILSEQYDLVIALYSHLITRYQTSTQDGSEPILRELLSILEPYTGTYSYQATKMLPFELAASTTNSFTISDGTNTDPVALGSTLTFASGSAALVPIVTNNNVTYSPTFGTTLNTFAQGNDSRFHNPVTIGTANGLSISTQALSLAAATSGSAGAMSASDKTKLDGIASGATANTGTVTSVALTTPAAFTVTGSPITTSGTLAIAAAGTSAQYITGAGALATLNTLNVPENTNLYFTPSRARTAISLTTTGTTGAATYDNTTGILNIPSYIGGVTSFNTRTGAIVLSSSDVTTALTYIPVPNNRSLTINGVSYDLSADRSWTIASGVTSFNTRTGAITPASGDYTTALVTEVTNLYYTDARARAAISLTTTGTSGAATYSSTTGVLNIPAYQGGVTSFNTRTGAITLTSGDVTTALTYTPYNATNPAGYISGITSGNVTTALGFTPENAANKGIANGYASLDGGGLIPSTQLPSYVDDVLEYTNLAGFPATGETGKIYVALDTNKIYRWSGATYIEVSPTVGTIWGGITGTLSNQTDLQTALNAKQNTLSGTGFVKSTAGTISYDTTTYYPYPTGTTSQYVSGDGSLIAFPTAGQAGTIVRLVRNQTGATLTKGTVVYISGATGNNPIVSKAIATGDSTSAQTFGLLQTDIANNATGYVVMTGDLTGLDTSAFTEGQQLYLSGTVAGTYTATKTLAPTHLVYVGIITRSHPTLGQIEVKIQNGYELGELHNVAAPNGSASNNDGLFWETSTQLWKNKSIATILGYTPANAARSLTINGTAYDLTADRTWSVGTVTSVGLTVPTGFTNGTSVTTSGNLTLGFATGYSLPTTASQTNWDTAYTNRITSLTTTGSSGSATLVSNTLNIPTYTLSGLGGQPLATNLTSLSGLAYVSSSFVKMTAAGTFSLDTNTYYLSSNPSNYIALTALSSTATGLTYTNTTGIFSLTSGYVIPATTSATNWDTAYTNRITTLTTTGSSGSATLSSNTLNIPTYTLSGLGGQALSTNLTSLSGLTYASTSFVKMTASGTFALDTSVYYLASNPNSYTANLGTVTSVAALTLGTTGTDLSSSVATGTTTPVITLNVPTASATNRGALSSADWTTFNSKQSTITLTTTGSSGASTLVSNTLNIPTYTLAGLGGVASTRTLTINGTTYDLSADRTWTISTNPSARVEQNFIATAAQTTFTITGGYVVGLVDVFVNGVRYLPSDYTATNGTTVVLGIGLLAGDAVTILNYTSSIAALPTSRNVQDFTATAGQTTFTVTNGYIVGLIDVFVNGSKLTSSEFTATNGTTFVLTVASTVGDQVQSINYTASVNGISGAGTANYVPKFTATGTIGNSSIQDLTTGVLVSNSVTAASAIARGTYLTPTLVASANSDVLVGLDIAPTFTNGAFTGVTNTALRLANNQFIGAKNNSSTTYNILGINSSNTVVFGNGTINSSFNGSTLDLGSNSSTGIRFYNGTQWGQIFGGTGNFILQNGGTFTDAGYRLDVVGTARVSGAATFSSTIQTGGDISLMNASGDISVKMKDSIGGASRVLTRQATTNNVYIGDIDPNGGKVIIRTNGNDAITVTAAGNVGIGTSSPTDSIIGSGVFLDIASTGGGALKLHYTNATAAGELSFYKGSNGSYIDSAGAATLANNDLIFRTGGTVSNYGVSERMRITSGGDFLVGRTDAGAGNLGGKISSTGFIEAVVNNDACFSANRKNATGVLMILQYQNSTKGTISTDGTTTSYNVTSDYRLKEDLKSINGLNIVNKINVYDFKWKDSQARMDGVLAHELAEVLPYAVIGQKDAKEMQGVDYSKIVPVLTKAVQELSAENTSLINRIEALENK